MQQTLNFKGRTAMRHMPGPEVNIISILVDLDAVPIKFAFHHNFLSTKLYTFYKINCVHIYTPLFMCPRNSRHGVCQVRTFFQASSTLETLAANCGRTALPTSISWQKRTLTVRQTRHIQHFEVMNVQPTQQVHLQKTTHDCHHVNWNC